MVRLGRFNNNARSESHHKLECETYSEKSKKIIPTIGICFKVWPDLHTLIVIGEIKYANKTLNKERVL